MIRRVLGIYFSPIGGTAEMTKSLAAGLVTNLAACCHEDIKYETCDLLTLPEDGIELDNETVAVIGFPVYIGKVPLLGIESLRRIKPNGAMSITLVSYASRSFGDALYELQHSAENIGFVTIGAGAIAVKYVRAPRGGCKVLRTVDSDAINAFCDAVSAKIRRIAGCDIEELKIKPAPLVVAGKLPTHRISKISPRAAELAEGVLEKLNIPHRQSEWYL